MIHHLEYFVNVAASSCSAVTLPAAIFLAARA